jgi:putative ABC transport system substrate-binding protein
MKRRATLIAAAAALGCPWPIRIRAQTRVRRIGYLTFGGDPGPTPPSFVADWKRLGWTLGETLHLEPRWADYRVERLPELADELVRHRGVELLMTVGPEAAAAASRITKTVPIVFNWSYFPILCGLVDSYAHPGRNATGIAQFDALDRTAKWTESLRMAAPNARRLAYISQDAGKTYTVSGNYFDFWPDSQAQAKEAGFEATLYLAERVEDVGPLLAQASTGGAEVALITGTPCAGAARAVAAHVLRHRWITTTLRPDCFELSGLLTYYGPTYRDFSGEKRAREMVNRILRGAKPADIPVDLPTTYELALNVKTARALGVTLPQSLLLRVDRIVE